MTIDEFDEHTLESLFLAISGFRELEEARGKISWERTRWATWLVLNSQYEKPLKKPTDIITFPWEKQVKIITKIDKVAVERLNAAFDAHAKKVFGNG